jgi:hypothetical protein
MRMVGMSTIAMMLVAACSNAAENSSAQAATTGQSGEATQRVAIASATSANAQPAANRCQNMRGQLIDPDPAGRNVRDAPNVNGRRLGVIAPPFVEGEFTLPAWFDIIASRNGWLLIENVELDGYVAEVVGQTAFTGRGWISGRGVLVTVQTSLGFASPSHQAPIVFDARDAGGIVDGRAEGMQVRGVAACSGNWVQLDWEAPGYRGVSAVGFQPSAVVSQDPLIVRAWHTGICHGPSSDCEGINGDRP